MITTALPATGPCLAPEQQAQPSANGPAATTSRVVRTSTSASAWTFKAWEKCWVRTSSEGWRSDVHYLIGILTEGDTRRDARDNALAFAGELVERGEFDFYDGQRARTYKLASALGKKAVEGALAANRREFDTALRAVKLMLQEFTDEQIYQDEYPAEPREYFASRYEFTQVA